MKIISSFHQSLHTYPINFSKKNKKSKEPSKNNQSEVTQQEHYINHRKRMMKQKWPYQEPPLSPKIKFYIEQQGYYPSTSNKVNQQIESALKLAQELKTLNNEKLILGQDQLIGGASSSHPYSHGTISYDVQDASSITLYNQFSDVEKKLYQSACTKYNSLKTLASQYIKTHPKPYEVSLATLNSVLKEPIHSWKTAIQTFSQLTPYSLTPISIEKLLSSLLTPPNT